MKIVEMKNTGHSYAGHWLIGLLLLLWALLQYWLRRADPALGYIDPNIWLLLLLSMICFLLITGLCWWLLTQFWLRLDLPDIGSMVVQFKKMEAWKQLGFYWVSLGLLLCAAIGCLNAIC